jgi:Fe-S cluster biogenesis protein NfuA
LLRPHSNFLTDSCGDSRLGCPSKRGDSLARLAKLSFTRSIVADSRDFREDMQRIGDLVQEIESSADPAVRAITKTLMQSLMDLHGAAIEKALDIVADSGEHGMAIIDRLGRDPLVSSVLILYGLHPEDLETRATKAVDKVRPQLRKQGCEVELVSVNDGAIRLRVETGSHTCGSTAKTLQATLEGTMYDAAPDLTSLVIEGFEEKPASGFVGLDKLISGTAATTAQPQGTD